MSRTTKPTHTVTLETKNGPMNPGAFSGRATAARLEAYVFGYNESIKPGGVNSHIPRMQNRSVEDCTVIKASIFRNGDTLEPVVFWQV